MVKNNFLDFPTLKVQWLQLTGEVGKSVAIDVKFSPDFMYQ